MTNMQKKFAGPIARNTAEEVIKLLNADPKEFASAVTTNKQA